MTKSNPLASLDTGAQLPLVPPRRFLGATILCLILALIVILTVIFDPKGILYYVQNRISLKTMLAELRQSGV